MPRFARQQRTPLLQALRQGVIRALLDDQTVDQTVRQSLGRLLDLTYIRLEQPIA